MKILDERYWSSFYKYRGKERVFDGLKFEELAEDLLKCLYDLPWIGTKGSHDGSRDFVAKNSEGEVWAECKMYQENLSIYVISPTLVMALLDGIQRLVIVSFSTLNHNALNHLATFRDVARCEIDLVDDLVLEAHIIAHWQHLLQHFPGLPKPAAPPPVPCVIDQELDLEPHLIRLKASRSDDAQDVGLPLLRLKQTLAIDVYIRNQDISTVASGIITIRCDRQSKAFIPLLAEGVSQAQSVSVPPGGTWHRRFYFKVAEYRTQPRLPKIYIAMTGQRESHVGGQNVVIQSLPFISLVGDANGVLADVGKKLDGGGVQAFCIAGRSGTGKSRLLREIADELVRNDYRVTALDTELNNTLTHADYVRMLLAQAYRLPLLQPELVKAELKTRGPDQRARLRNSRVARIEEILYEPIVSLSGLTDECVDLLLDAMVSKKSALIIDNMQFLPEETCRFFNRLLDKATQAGECCRLIFGVNTDFLIPGSISSSLYARLKSLPTPERHLFRELMDFGHTAAEAFLNASLSFAQKTIREQFTQRFPDISSDFLKHRALRPLYLEQALLFLESEGVLRRRGARLVVADIDRYQICRDALSGNIRRLIEARWNHQLDHEPDPANARLAVEALALFFIAPEALIMSMKVERTTLDRLVEAGILRRDSDRSITFYHRELFQYFLIHLGTPSLETAERVVETLDQRNWSDRHFVSYLLARQVTTGINRELLKKGCAKLTTDRIKGERQADALTLIINEAVEQADALEPASVLTVISEGPARLSHVAGEKKVLDALQPCLTHIQEHTERYEAHGEAYADCVQRLASLYYARNRYLPVVPLMERTLQRFDHLGIAAPHRKALLQARLHNRLGVAYMHFNDFSRSLNNAQRARDLAEEANDPMVIIECEIDLGNLYDFLMPGRPPEMAAHWKRASEKLAEHPELTENTHGTYPKSMVRLYEAQLLLLNGDVAGARALLGPIVSECREKLDHFFGVKCLALQVVSYLLPEAGAFDTRDVIRTLDRLLDWATSTGVSYATWTIHLLRARVAERTGQPHDAHRDYVLALERFLATEPTAAMEEMRHHFFEDAFLHLRRLSEVPASAGEDEKTDEDNPERLTAIIRSIRSMRIRDRFADVMDATPKAFAQMWEDHRAETTMTDGKFMLPL